MPRTYNRKGSRYLTPTKIYGGGKKKKRSRSKKRVSKKRSRKQNSKGKKRSRRSYGKKRSRKQSGGKKRRSRRQSGGKKRRSRRQSGGKKRRSRRQSGGKKRRSKKTGSKKKRSRKRSRKQSRGLNPALAAFQKLVKHISGKIGTGGRVAMKIASVYKKKVDATGKTPDEVTNEAIKLFDKEPESKYAQLIANAKN